MSAPQEVNMVSGVDSPSLFNQNFGTSNKHIPLAHRLRPTNFDDFFGQKHLLDSKSSLREWIKSGRLPSLILWGPPGCGKTTLAKIIALNVDAEFISLSAVLAGIKDIKDSVKRAAEAGFRGKSTILFLDEIHRFNKAQQDALLPHVEEGTLKLIGATTENPSFEVNAALLSRTQVLRFEALSPSELKNLISHTLQNKKTEFNSSFSLTEEATALLAQLSAGDVRRALNLLDLIDHSLGGQKIAKAFDKEETLKLINKSEKEAVALRYDKSGEEHYNIVSAFIKSMRGSDIDAALYYLARMLEGGEDPKFILRRMLVFASEDIGMADPHAITLINAIKDTVHFVGMPEARINLAHGVSYLSLAPKSNASYLAIDSALAEVRKSGALEVPMALRNGVTKDMKKWGYGKDYQYAHNYKDAKINQQHLPDQIKDKKFYKKSLAK